MGAPGLDFETWESEKDRKPPSTEDHTMKGVRYTKYNGDLASEMDLESLLQALSDFFLDSGFNDPYSNFGEMDNSPRSPPRSPAPDPRVRRIFR
jgi:hypothetical protein